MNDYLSHYAQVILITKLCEHYHVIIRLQDFSWQL